MNGALVSSVVGGTASVLGGGKFSNGALTGAFSYLCNRCAHMTVACAKSWAGAAANIVGGGVAIAGGTGLCSTGLGCLAGAPTVAIGVGSVGEGINWVLESDENVAGRNVVKEGFVGTLKMFGASDKSASLGFTAFELGAAGLSLKAPIALEEQLWTMYGPTTTTGLKVVVPAITTERYRTMATVKPFYDAGSSAYETAKEGK